ncbi:MAG TPA: AbrB/MazE/SpoVT family DNA-binding domain-containing protein [Hyphomicrobiaceae bacterium]
MEATIEATLKKHGNSVGLIIPKVLRDALRLGAGQTVTLEQTDGGLLLKPAKQRRFTLDALLAECDPAAPMPEPLREWDSARAVGREEW